jgi:hypothetical protein
VLYQSDYDRKTVAAGGNIGIHKKSRELAVKSFVDSARQQATVIIELFDCSSAQLKI